MSILSEISMIDYPYNLIYDVFQKDIYEEIDCPDDVEESVAHVLSLLPEIEQKVIFYRYSEHKKMREIAVLVGFESRQATYNRLKSALKKLSQPINSKYFLIGKAKVEKRRATKKTSAEQSRDYGDISRMTKRQLGKVPVECLGLSARAVNVLKRNGIDTIGKLCRLSDSELLEMRYVGKTVSAEIRDSLRQAGIGE